MTLFTGFNYTYIAEDLLKCCREIKETINISSFFYLTLYLILFLHPITVPALNASFRYPFQEFDAMMNTSIFGQVTRDRIDKMTCMWHLIRGWGQQ